MKKIKLYALFILALLLSSNVSTQPVSGFKFNGSSQYMKIPNHADLTINDNESFTVTFWAKANTVLTRHQRLVNCRTGDADNTGFGITFLSTGFIYADAVSPTGNKSIYNQSFNKYTANEWIHITASYNMTNKEFSLYRNGVLVGTSPTPTGSTNLATTSDIYVGAWKNTIAPTIIEFFDGEIANLRFWNKSFDAAASLADMNAVVDNTTPDLLAGYDFGTITQEGDNKFVADIKGNHPGILYGFEEPKNAGLSFDGTQYMTIANHSDFNIAANGALSISCWVQGEVNSSVVQRIIGKRYTDVTNTGYGMALLNSSPNTNKTYAEGVYTTTNNGVVGTSTYGQGEWFHLTAVIDLSVKKVILYKNGIKEKEAYNVNLSSINNESDVYVAAWKDKVGALKPGYNLKGKIANLRFWNKALTLAEVVADRLSEVSSSTPNLIAAYDFTNITEGVVADIKGNHPGTLYGFEGDEVVVGEPSTAGLTFDGIKEYMSIANHTDLNIAENGALTISCWLQTDIDNVTQRIIGKRFSDDNTGYGMALVNGAKAFADAVIPGNNTGVLGSTTYEKNKWFHVAAVINLQTKDVMLYKNGVLDNGGKTTANTIAGMSDVYVGAWMIRSTDISPQNYYAGKMANLRFWNKAMTVEEVIADFTANVTAETPNLVAAYDFTNITDEGVVADITGDHPGTLHGFDDFTSVVSVTSPLDKYLKTTLVNEELQFNAAVDKVSVYTLAGELIKAQEGGVTTMDVSLLPQGIYIVRYEKNNELVNHKIIKLK